MDTDGGDGQGLEGVEGGETAQVILYDKKSMFDKGKKLKDKIKTPQFLCFI